VAPALVIPAVMSTAAAALVSAISRVRRGDMEVFPFVVVPPQRDSGDAGYAGARSAGPASC
jgi:hypothetical protein